MQARDLFGIVVRVGGVTLIVFGLIDLADLAIRFAGLPLASTHPTSTIAAGALLYLALGLLLFAGAGLITSIAYGPASPRE